jgi:DnaK suppressor protein
VRALVRQAEVQLAEIDAAEGRLSDGTYGVCERCGALIGEARLEARPTARLCMECARA